MEKSSISKKRFGRRILALTLALLLALPNTSLLGNLGLGTFTSLAGETEQTLVASPNSVSLNVGGSNGTVTISGDHTALSLGNDHDEGVATATLNDHTVTITPVGVGTTSIKVNAAEDATYAAGQVSISVSVAAAKTTQTLSASPSSVSLNVGGSNGTVTISGDHTALSLGDDHDEGVATATLNDHTVTITPVGVGTTSIKVNAAEDATYAAGQVIISVSIAAAEDPAATINPVASPSAKVGVAKSVLELIDTVSLTPSGSVNKTTGTWTFTVTDAGTTGVPAGVLAGGKDATFTASATGTLKIKADLAAKTGTNKAATANITVNVSEKSTTALDLYLDEQAELLLNKSGKVGNTIASISAGEKGEDGLTEYEVVYYDEEDPGDIYNDLAELFVVDSDFILPKGTEVQSGVTLTAALPFFSPAICDEDGNACTDMDEIAAVLTASKKVCVVGEPNDDIEIDADAVDHPAAGTNSGTTLNYALSFGTTIFDGTNTNSAITAGAVLPEGLDWDFEPADADKAATAYLSKSNPNKNKWAAKLSPYFGTTDNTEVATAHIILKDDSTQVFDAANAETYTAGAAKTFTLSRTASSRVVMPEAVDTDTILAAPNPGESDPGYADWLANINKVNDLYADNIYSVAVSSNTATFTILDAEIFNAEGNKDAKKALIANVVLNAESLFSAENPKVYDVVFTDGEGDPADSESSLQYPDFAALSAAAIKANVAAKAGITSSTAATRNATLAASGTTFTPTSGNYVDVIAGGEPLRVEVSLSQLESGWTKKPNGDNDATLTWKVGITEAGTSNGAAVETIKLYSNYNKSMGALSGLIGTYSAAVDANVETAGSDTLTFYIDPLVQTTTATGTATITLDLYDDTADLTGAGKTLASFTVSVKEDESTKKAFKIETFKGENAWITTNGEANNGTVIKGADLSTPEIAFKNVDHVTPGDKKANGTEITLGASSTKVKSLNVQPLKISLVDHKGDALASHDAMSVTVTATQVDFDGTDGNDDLVKVSVDGTNYGTEKTKSLSANECADGASFVVYVEAEDLKGASHAETDITVSASGNKFKSKKFHVSVDQYYGIKVVAATDSLTAAQLTLKKVKNQSTGAEEDITVPEFYFASGASIYTDVAKVIPVLDYWTLKDSTANRTGLKIVNGTGTITGATRPSGLTDGYEIVAANDSLKLAKKNTLTLFATRAKTASIGSMSIKVGDGTAQTTNTNTEITLLNVGTTKDGSLSSSKAASNKNHKAVLTVNVKDAVEGDTIALAATGFKITNPGSTTTENSSSYTIKSSDLKSGAGALNFTIETTVNNANTAQAAATATLTSAGSSTTDSASFKIKGVQRFLVKIDNPKDITGSGVELKNYAIKTSYVEIPYGVTLSGLSSYLMSEVEKGNVLTHSGTGTQLSGFYGSSSKAPLSGSTITNDSTAVYPVEEAESVTVKFELDSTIAGLKVSTNELSTSAGDALEAPGSVSSNVGKTINAPVHATEVKRFTASPQWTWAGYTLDSAGNKTEFIFADDSRVNSSKSSSFVGAKTPTALTGDTTVYLTLKTDITVSSSGLTDATAVKAGKQTGVWTPSGSAQYITLNYGESIGNAAGSIFNPSTPYAASADKAYFYGFSDGSSAWTADTKATIATVSAAKTLTPVTATRLTFSFVKLSSGTVNEANAFVNSSVKTYDIPAGDTRTTQQILDDLGSVFYPSLDGTDGVYKAGLYTSLVESGDDKGKVSGSALSGSTAKSELTSTKTLYLAYSKVDSGAAKINPADAESKVVIDVDSNAEAANYYPVEVRVLDKNNQNLASATVSWTTNAAGGLYTTTDFSSGSAYSGAVETTTDSEGKAKLGIAKTSAAAWPSGGYELVATANGISTVFTVTYDAPALVTLDYSASTQTTVGGTSALAAIKADFDQVQGHGDITVTGTDEYTKVYHASEGTTLAQIVKEWETDYAVDGLYGLANETKYSKFLGLAVSTAYNYTNAAGVPKSIAVGTMLKDVVSEGGAHAGATLQGALEVAPVYANVVPVSVALDSDLAGKTVGKKTVISQLPAKFATVNVKVADPADIENNTNSVVSAQLPTASDLNLGGSWTPYFYTLDSNNKPVQYVPGTTPITADNTKIYVSAKQNVTLSPSSTATAVNATASAENFAATVSASFNVDVLYGKTVDFLNNFPMPYNYKTSMTGIATIVNSGSYADLKFAGLGLITDVNDLTGARTWKDFDYTKPVTDENLPNGYQLRWLAPITLKTRPDGNESFAASLVPTAANTVANYMYFYVGEPLDKLPAQSDIVPSYPNMTVEFAGWTTNQNATVTKRTDGTFDVQNEVKLGTVITNPTAASTTLYAAYAKTQTKIKLTIAAPGANGNYTWNAAAQQIGGTSLTTPLTLELAADATWADVETAITSYVTVKIDEGYMLAGASKALLSQPKQFKGAKIEEVPAGSHPSVSTLVPVGDLTVVPNIVKDVYEVKISLGMSKWKNAQIAKASEKTKSITSADAGTAFVVNVVRGDGDPEKNTLDIAELNNLFANITGYSEGVLIPDETTEEEYKVFGLRYIDANNKSKYITLNELKNNGGLYVLEEDGEGNALYTQKNGAYEFTIVFYPSRIRLAFTAGTGASWKSNTVPPVAGLTYIPASATETTYGGTWGYLAETVKLNGKNAGTPADYGVKLSGDVLKSFNSVGAGIVPASADKRFKEFKYTTETGGLQTLDYEAGMTWTQDMLKTFTATYGDAPAVVTYTLGELDGKNSLTNYTAVKSDLDALNSFAATYDQARNAKLGKLIPGSSGSETAYAAKLNVFKTRTSDASTTIGAWYFDGWDLVTTTASGITKTAFDPAKDSISGGTATLAARWVTPVYVYNEASALTGGTPKNLATGREYGLNWVEYGTVFTKTYTDALLTKAPADVEGKVSFQGWFIGKNGDLAAAYTAALAASGTKYDATGVKLDTSQIQDAPMTMVARFYTLATLTATEYDEVEIYDPSPANMDLEESKRKKIKVKYYWADSTGSVKLDGSAVTPAPERTEPKRTIRVYAGSAASFSTEATAYRAKLQVTTNLRGWYEDTAGEKQVSGIKAAEQAVYPVYATSQQYYEINLKQGTNGKWATVHVEQITLIDSTGRKTIKDLWTQISANYADNGVYTLTGLKAGDKALTAASTDTLASLATLSGNSSVINITAVYERTRLMVQVKAGTNGQVKTGFTSANYDNGTKTYTFYKTMKDGAATVTAADFAEFTEALVDVTSAGYFLNDAVWLGGTNGTTPVLRTGLASGYTMTAANATLTAQYEIPSTTNMHVVLKDENGKNIVTAVNSAAMEKATKNLSPWYNTTTDVIDVPKTKSIKAEVVYNAGYEWMAAKTANYVYPTVVITQGNLGLADGFAMVDTLGSVWKANKSNLDAQNVEIFTGKYNISFNIYNKAGTTPTAPVVTTNANNDKLRVAQGPEDLLNADFAAMGFSSANGMLVVVNDYLGKTVNDKKIVTLDQLALTGMTKAPVNGIRSITNDPNNGSFAWRLDGTNPASKIKLADYKNSAATVDVDVVYTPKNGDPMNYVVPVTFITANYSLTLTNVYDNNAADVLLASNVDYLVAKYNASTDEIPKAVYDLKVSYVAPKAVLGLLDDGADTAVDDIANFYGSIDGTIAGAVRTTAWSWTTVNAGSNKAPAFNFSQDGKTLDAALNPQTIALGTKGYSARAELKIDGSYNGGEFKVSTKLVVTRGAYPVSVEDEKDVYISATGAFPQAGSNTSTINGLNVNLNDQIDGYDKDVYSYIDFADNMKFIRVDGKIEGGLHQAADWSKVKISADSDNKSAVKLAAASASKADGFKSNPAVYTKSGNTDDLFFSVYLQTVKPGQAVIKVSNNDDNKSEFKFVVNALGDGVTLTSGGVNVAGSTITTNLLLANDAGKTVALKLKAPEYQTSHDMNGGNATQVTGYALKGSLPAGVVIAGAVNGDDYDLTLTLSTGGKKTLNFIPTVVDGNGNAISASPIKVTLNVLDKLPTVSAKVDGKFNLALYEPESSVTLTGSSAIESVEVVSTDGKNYTKFSKAGNLTEEQLTDINLDNIGYGTTTTFDLRFSDFAKGAQVAKAADFPAKVVLKVRFAGFSAAQAAYVTLSPSYQSIMPTVQIEKNTKNFTLYPSLFLNGGKFTVNLNKRNDAVISDDTGKISFADEYKKEAENYFKVSTDNNVGSDVVATVNKNAVDGSKRGISVRFDIPAGTTAPAGKTYKNAFWYSDTRYRGIPLGVNFTVSAKAVNVSKFYKMDKMVLNLNKDSDIAMRDLMVLPGVYASLDNLKITEKASKKMAGQNIEFGFIGEPNDGSYSVSDEYPVVYAKFGASKPAKGSYTYEVSGSFNGKTITGSFVVDVTDTAIENSVKLTKAGAIDVMNRASQSFTVTAQLQKINGTITGARFVDENLDKTFQILPAGNGGTDYSVFTIKLWGDAQNVFTLKPYDAAVKLTITTLDGEDSYEFEPVKSAQSAMKSLKLTQSKATINLLFGKLKNNYVIEGADNGAVTMTGTGFNISVSSKIGKLSPDSLDWTIGNNNRKSEAVYDTGNFLVTTPNIDGGGVINVKQVKKLPKGTYQIRFYLYPEGCANDTKPTVIKYSVKVK